MATFTATQIKDRTSVSSVQNWSDDKILLYQATAEAWLGALDLEDGATGYTDAYNGALILLFDTIAVNPTGMKSKRRGKTGEQYGDNLPPMVSAILEPFMTRGVGFLEPSLIKRKTMGLR